MFKPKRAVIAGAGIAGLATALRLSRDGWEVLVLERAPARRSGGYLVNLLGPGYDAVAATGLVDDLRRVDIGLVTTRLTRADGSVKTTVPEEVAQAALGERTLSVFRGDLEATLYAHARDRAEIRFGTTVAGFEQDAHRVQVVLSDGRTHEADLLVGADGLHSATRRRLFGDGGEKHFPYVVGALPLTAAGPPGSATTFIGVGRTASIMNLGPDRSSAFFAYRCADPAAELAKGPVAALTAAFGDLGGDVPAALAEVTADAYFDRASQVVLDRWTDGRVALLGDAAWCVTVFAGHGAGLAVAGADRLGTTLERGGTLADWEAALRPETLRRQRDAQRGMLQFAPPSAFHVRMGDLMIRAMTLPGIRTVIRRSISRGRSRARS